MSTIKKQGIRNTIITYIGVIIGFVSLLFIQPALLKPEELGLTRILIAAASLIATILPLGVSSVTTKFFPYFRNAENRHNGYFGFMFLFPLIGTVVCGILIYSFRQIIIEQYQAQSPLFTRYFELLLPFAIIIGVNMTLNAYIASLFKTTIISFFEGIVSRLLFILIIIIYYFHFITLTQFIYLFVAIYLVQAVTMIAYIFIIDTPSLTINRKVLNSVGIPKLFRFGLFLTIASFSSLSLKHLDSIMIGKYLSLEYVGIFSVSAYLALVIEIPLTSLEKITHTKIAQAWANADITAIKAIYYQSVKYLLLIGGLILVGITTNITELLSFLPKPYQQGGTVAIIACVGGFLNIATGVNTSILFTSSKYLYGTLLIFILLILAIALNIVLIPVYGINGAALATAISSITYNLLKYLIIWKHFKMQPYNSTSLKIIFIIILTFSIALIVPSFSNPAISIVVKSSITIIIYLISTYTLNIIPEFHKYLPFKK